MAAVRDGRIARLETRDLTKIYGRNRALFGVDLRAEAGRILALLGPNGSGKSTLLSLLSTLVRPTRGSIFFDGEPIEKRPELRAHIGLVSHAALVYGDLTALENVVFFARLYGAVDPIGVAKEQLFAFGLERASHKPARALSRGMLQRLSLARALVGTPSLVLLDEPFTGLDRASTASLVSRVRSLKDRGAIVVLVSHDMGTSCELADEIVVLRSGEVQARAMGPFDLSRLYAIYDAAQSGPTHVPTHPT